MKKRLVYWIAERILPLHENRAKLLNAKGFEVHFFTLLESLLAQVEAKRTGIIIIGDFDSEKNLERIVMKLSNMPETQAARLVLSLEGRFPKVLFLAACTTFRDVIPMNIDDDQWFQRIMFATAARPIEFSQPTGQITMNTVSTLSLPARIVWISRKRVRLECRLKPSPGAILNLEGPFVESFGVKSIPLKVDGTARNNLVYRFSDAVVGSWSLSAPVQSKVDTLINKLRINDVGTRCKVFLVVQSTKFRNAILQKLDHPKIELNAALQKQSIVSEPIFFTPDIVFIEDRLCLESKGQLFQQMLKTLRENVPIVVLGDTLSLQTLKSLYPHRQLIGLSQIPTDLSEQVLTSFLPSSWQSMKTEEGSVNILSENPVSYARISFPARVTKLHPLALEMTFPFPIGNFALCQVESPVIRRILGKNPYVKFTKVFPNTRTADTSFMFTGETYLVDTDKEERKTLATSLSKLVTDYMHRYIPENIAPITETNPAIPIGKGVPVEKTLEGGKDDLLDIPMYEKGAPETFFEEISQKLPAARARIDDATFSVRRNVIHTLRNETLQHVVIWIAISAFFAAVLWTAVTLLEPRWQKSGKQYSEAFEKFAPAYFKSKAKQNEEKKPTKENESENIEE